MWGLLLSEWTEVGVPGEAKVHPDPPDSAHPRLGHAVAVRPGTAADVEDALTVWHAAKARWRGRSRQEGRNGDQKRRRLAGPETFFLVAQSAESGVIGLAAGLSGRRDGGAGPTVPGLCHISMVAVHPEHWRQGVGGQLVQALLRHGRDLGYDRFQLYTQADNAPARRLYEGMSFTSTDRTATSAEGDSLVQYVWGEGR